MKYILCGLLKIYHFFSKYTPPVCKFSPTCSHYAFTAIKRFGAFYGSYLAIKRLFRCHPWSLGGIDPVPEKIDYLSVHTRRLQTVRKGK